MGVVVVFGATGGIGQALVRRLRRTGRPVHLVARDEARLQALGNDVDAGFSVADARDAAAVQAALQQAATEHGVVDGVVGAVGSIVLRPLHLTRDEDFDDVIAQNLKSAFFIARAAVRSFQATKTAGSIVLFSSAAARAGLPSHEAIAAAKAGVDGLVRSAAATYASARIRINAIAPGLVDTPLAARLLSTPAAREASEQRHPLGRIGQPDEVAALAALLLSDDAAGITGETFGVDGGLALLRPLGKA
jgi:NAD(P)-dependent dehydrogenase (short-subunit alcohol dehydrogenase family)